MSAAVLDSPLVQKISDIAGKSDDALSSEIRNLIQGFQDGQPVAARWRVATNGAKERSWFLLRDVQTLETSYLEYLETPSGAVKRFTMEKAYLMAEKLNA